MQIKSSQMEIQNQNLQPNLPPEQSKPSNIWFDKKHVITYIIVLVGLAIIGGAIYAYQWERTKYPCGRELAGDCLQIVGDITAPDPTANWKKYSNSQYGFEFNYPNSWPDLKTTTVASTNSQGTASIYFCLPGAENYLEKNCAQPYKGYDRVFELQVLTNKQWDDYYAQEYNNYQEGPRIELVGGNDKYTFIWVSHQDTGTEIVPTGDTMTKIDTTFEFTNFHDIDTSTWKTYSDNQYGFEFKYPADWNLRNQTQDVFKTDMIFESKTGNTIEFILTNEEFTPCEEDCTSNHVQNISGKNWTIYDLSYDKKQGKAAVLKNNNLRFAFSTSLSATFNSQTFDQLLSTFKFTK
jgi:hypothetical protein